MNTNQERLLNMISENKGVIPKEPKHGPGHQNEGPFDRETPFSTRYFTITYDADGTVLQSDFPELPLLRPRTPRNIFPLPCAMAWATAGVEPINIRSRTRTTASWRCSWTARRK